MGAGVSSWRLAQAVSKVGQLGVVSGTGLAEVVARRLQDGDPGGHTRRAFEQFPFPQMAQRVLDTLFVPGGKPKDIPYRRLPTLDLDGKKEPMEHSIVGNFVEVFLAREGHANPVGINYLEKIQCPAVLALNKVDLLDKEQLLPVIDWYSSLHPFTAVVPVSALKGDGTDILLNELVSRLPEGPQYYPDDIPTDSTERFIVAELIREKIFLRTHQEVPYSTAVLIDSFKENEQGGPVVIHATILVERGSQKGIIIGRQGKMLGDIRKAATKDIAKLLLGEV